MSGIKGLDWLDGQSNIPGLRKYAYAIAKSDIGVWPTLPTTYTTAMGELVTYAGSFTLLGLAKWQKVALIVDKSPVESKSQGVRPSKTFLNTLTMHHAGVGADATGFALIANNNDFVYAVQTKPGKWRIVGNEMFQSNTEIDQKLGGSPTDEMGTSMVVTVTDICPAPYYEGDLVCADGTIDCSPV